MIDFLDNIISLFFTLIGVVVAATLFVAFAYTTIQIFLNIPIP